MRRRTAGIAVACAALAVCASTAAVPSATAAGANRAAGSRPSATGASPALVQARRAYARLSRRERVGQLFVLGVPSTGPSRADRLNLRHGAAGNVYLSDNTSAGVAGVRAITRHLQPVLRHSGVRPFIGTDQEGGEVQRLRGRGFSTMPTALTQGRLSIGVLQGRSHAWSKQLRRAGLNLNLAPVADTVPRSVGTRNQPIGRYYREFGHTVGRVRAHVAASVRGWQATGLAATVKHFPGLGRASGNTDTERGVTDPTTARSPYLTPYRAGIAAGAQFVMVSSARYPHIDPHHLACFSHRIIHGLLRGRERFHGIVVTDSFSATAVSGVPAGIRASRFLRSGGTMILDSTTAQLHAMEAGVLHQMQINPKFAALVRNDVLRVLVAKAHDGLVGH